MTVINATITATNTKIMAYMEARNQLKKVIEISNGDEDKVDSDNRRSILEKHAWLAPKTGAFL